MDRTSKRAARAALDEYQATITRSRTLSALGEGRVRFAESLAAALPLSDDDRLDLVNALLGREDKARPKAGPEHVRDPALLERRGGASRSLVGVG